MIEYKISFITPLFSRGALEIPEVRPPSIRGQLHWWFRALGGTHANEKDVFGGVHNGASASKVIVRVSQVEGKVDQFKTLPHKQGGLAAPKSAFTPASSYNLHISTRLGGFKNELQHNLFDRALEAWLLLGTLGLRSTRAAGSFIWKPLGADGIEMPDSIYNYNARCRSVLANAALRYAISETRYDSAEDARCVISDTLGGREDNEGQNDLARLHYPLGKVFKGRKTSPLRFRIISPNSDGFYIAAVWDDRQVVTGNSVGDLEGLVRLLQRRKPQLGNQLGGLLNRH